MKKKFLSTLLCFCMVMTMLSAVTTIANASTIIYEEYNILSDELEHVETVLSGIADVTKDENVVTIKLTSDVYGRIHFGTDSLSSADKMSGTFILDLGGKTIDAGGNKEEALCLDHTFIGTVTITGEGKLKTGTNHIIYNDGIWGCTFNFALADGKVYFTLKNGDTDIFDEKNFTEKTVTDNIDGIELVMTQGNNATGTTYTYAYDVQRSPAFPESEGDEITVHSFSKPLNRSETRYSSFEGEWALTEVGAYSEKSSFDPAPNYYLDGIVDSVANKYDLNVDGKNGLIIHKLVDENDDLVGYGVVIAIDETNGYALFIADIWGNSGAGYLLSSTEISDDSITLNTEQMAQSTYSISLTPATVLFTEVQTGYSEPAAQVITITNTGDIDTGDLTVSLSGGNDSNFILSKSNIDSITDSGNDTFTVVPKTGLVAGTFTETITVNGDMILPQTVDVSFTVTAPPAYSVTFDANSGSVTTTNATTASDGKLAVLPTPTRSGSYTFNGWFTASSGGTEITTDTVFSADTTIYAQWSYTGSSGGGSRRYTVKFEANGGTTVANKTVTRNSKVSEPAAPEKEGYTFMGWFRDEELTSAYDFESKVTKNFTIYAKWEKVDDEESETPEAPETLEDTDTHNCISLNFADLDVNAWYHEDVDYVIENGIFKGITETTFAPNNKLTRAMLVTVLYRIENEPATNRSIPFADVDMGAYYANAVSWAKQNGIVNGITENEFAPDSNITREQIAAIIMRYVVYKGMYTLTLEENLHFADSNEISEYAVSSMNWAVGSGLINGKSETTLAPKDNATRAEIAAILHRFIKAN
ncbi:MAG: InlB B-repeat-containing protein [Clostridia bacterium]|nr:InlB B-repeat-containing protein [Clostridia bacterium]